jgi:hypothetical protein
MAGTIAPIGARKRSACDQPAAGPSRRAALGVVRGDHRSASVGASSRLIRNRHQLGKRDHRMIPACWSAESFGSDATPLSSAIDGGDTSVVVAAGQPRQMSVGTSRSRVAGGLVPVDIESSGHMRQELGQLHGVPGATTAARLLEGVARAGWRSCSGPRCSARTKPAVAAPSI